MNWMPYAGIAPCRARKSSWPKMPMLNVFPQSFETPANIAAVLSQLALYGLEDQYLTGYAAALAATNKDEVDEAMRQLVESDARTVLVVGDRQRRRPLN